MSSGPGSSSAWSHFSAAINDDDDIDWMVPINPVGTKKEDYSAEIGATTEKKISSAVCKVNPLNEMNTMDKCLFQLKRQS